MGSLESDTTERLHFHFSLSCTGEGNGNPLQCSCLENPRDRGTWWASVYGVAQSRTQLKRLSSSSSSIRYGDIRRTYTTKEIFLMDKGLEYNSSPRRYESESEVAQSCSTLCDPLDCSLPGFSVYGILQARILE